METSLLTTKLNIPPARANVMTRPRLTGRLQEGLRCNLILVSAPAGFGKTTLLSEWARQNQPRMRTAWVSLDEGDNDPVRFWDYLIAALKTLHPTFGESTRALLHSSQPPPVESLLTVLINELAGITCEFVLVLDDFHFISSQQIHDGITYLIEHMAVQMHLVIATRVDPPLPLAHFRGKGTLLEIGADDLRFSQEETTSLLAAMDTPPLSAESINALNTRAEGWAVGLKMAALSLRHQKDIPGFIASFTGSQRYIMDYLMEEVLRQQTEEVREFLLKTSVLERLTAPLCDAVTGRKDSHDMLHLLEQAQLFIVPLDESRQWYRYEHLFADILRHQLETVSSEQEVEELHRIASQWYEEHKFPDDAIHHALAARDWERATRLITERSTGKTHNAEFVTLFNWMQQLPEEVLLSHPILCIIYSSTLTIIGQLDAADAYLKKIEEAAQSDDNIKGHLYFQRAYQAILRSDMFLAEKLGREALSFLPLDNLDLRCIIYSTLGGIYYLRGNFKEAEPLLTEAFKFAKQVENYTIKVNSLVYLGRIIWQRGKMRRAADMFRQAIELAGNSPVAYNPHLLLSEILYEWNDLEGAANHVQRAFELVQLVGNVQARAIIQNTIALYRLAQGDEAGTPKVVEKADFAAYNSLNRATYASQRIEFALRQGDLAAALEWGKKLTEDAFALPCDLRAIPIRLLIAQGKKSEALEKLQSLYEQSVQGGAQSNLVTIRMYQALAAATQESALEFLSDALNMAEPEGYIRTFVDEGKLLAPLLRKAIARGIMPDYAGKLLTIIEIEERRKLQRVEGVPSRPPELLSEREIEVLRLLAEGLSNRQIAERLFITTGTVKTHVHNIIEKLYVRGRTQAISRARELKLI